MFLNSLLYIYIYIYIYIYALESEGIFNCLVYYNNNEHVFLKDIFKISLLQSSQIFCNVNLI